jgi:hypothetical protein
MGMNDRNLVGRALELEALQVALSEAARGERTVLMFSGEPGIGKTRMLEELATRAVAEGAMVAWGRVSEVGFVSSFWPWLQVLAAVETPLDPAPALGSLDKAASAAARLMRFGEVRAFLKRRAATAPLALLLDDLHAADISSLELLEDLLPALLGCRVLLALAARDGDASPEVAARLGRIAQTARRLPLARLGAPEVESLVGGRAPADRVLSLSEGNPLFVKELVASHREHGTLGLPRLSSVRSVIRERVSRFPAATRRALESAAILGRDFQGRVVVDMLRSSAPTAAEGERSPEPPAPERPAPNPPGPKALSPATWRPATFALETPRLESTLADRVSLELEPALACGVLGAVGPDRFRFSHALVAEAIADELGAASRTHHHLAAARALARLAPSESGAIAHHLLAAGPIAAARAVDAAEHAARQCMAMLAFEDAAALLARALTALELVLPDDAMRRAELSCQRAEALQHAARHAAAAELCDAAIDIVRASTPADGVRGNALFARIALARGLELRPGRTDPRLVALLSEALERIPLAEVGLRARLLARLAAAEQPAHDPSGPIARALEAIELGADLDPRARLDVMYVATAALVEYLEGARLERLHREVLALARGHRWVSVHTRLRLCFAMLDQGQRERFHGEAAAFEAEAAALGLPQWTRHVHGLRALVALLDGDFIRAEREAQQSEAISSALGDGAAAWRMGVHRSIARWTQTAPLDPGARAGLTRDTPGRSAIAAWFALQAGEHERVREALAEIGSEVPLDADFAAMLGCATAFAGGAERAAQVYGACVGRRARPVLASMVGSAIFDLQERVLLVLAAAAGRHEAIDAHAQAALTSAQRLGSPVWVARVRADWADALGRRGGAGDAERALDLRALAFADALRFGMPGLIERCRPPAASEVEPAVCGAGPTSARAVEQPPRLAAPARVALSRTGALWRMTGFGEEALVKDSRGLQMLARLLAEPGRELHVLDLGGGAAPIDGGDAGAALDPTARDRYRARLRELADERDTAEALGDRGRLERLAGETEALTGELERAFGLGGRERRIGAASERARSNVQRRLAHALERVRAASPRLGAHLTAALRTGTYCVYDPRG